MKEFHGQHAVKARQHYLDALNPTEGAADWLFALRDARKVISAALKASQNLQKIEQALNLDGAHMLVFRHLTAPPVSQDQFKLRCPAWSKSFEKGGRPVPHKEAEQIAGVFGKWRDRHLTRWLDKNRAPQLSDIREVLLAISPLIASQKIATARRNRIAADQEQAVIDLLIKKGWTRLPSRLISTQGAVPAKHFMQKTRFATASKTPQEVDIACGLKNTVVLAMECKVTNDETNSVKRVNDVIKKAVAWKDHYGNFVVTAALLQGVIAIKDVNRLLDNGIHVFWSHDLYSFETWLDKQL
jgi:hypothetical protein